MGGNDKWDLRFFEMAREVKAATNYIGNDGLSKKNAIFAADYAVPPLESGLILFTFIDNQFTTKTKNEYSI